MVPDPSISRTHHSNLLLVHHLALSGFRHHARCWFPNWNTVVSLSLHLIKSWQASVQMSLRQGALFWGGVRCSDMTTCFWSSLLRTSSLVLKLFKFNCLIRLSGYMQSWDPEPDSLSLNHSFMSGLPCELKNDNRHPWVSTPLLSYGDKL